MIKVLPSFSQEYKHVLQRIQLRDLRSKLHTLLKLGQIRIRHWFLGELFHSKEELFPRDDFGLCLSSLRLNNLLV